jgi:hypothetical protein
MKISKIYSKKAVKASKAVITNASTSKNTKIRHEFRVLSADEINNNRSNAYQYLVF